MLDQAGIRVFIDKHFTRSAFRLETLDRYTVESDEGNVDAYLAGAEAPSWADGSEWFDRLAAERAAGKRRYRVHVVCGPLGDYLRYECEWGYVFTARAGEEIYILDLAELDEHPAGIVDEDYWLLDDEHLLRMVYDTAGHLFGADIASDDQLERYRRSRDIALAHAVPFERYWAEHPQYWRANWDASASDAGRSA